jgi:glutamate dehydrogenase/leucine dehydrogenase
LSFEQTRELFLRKDANKLVADNLISFEETNERIWNIGAEVFIPGAASRLISKDQVDRMIQSGLEVISCGANVPFNDAEIFYGPVYEYADSQVSVIPDFIANCGMARAFAFLMQGNVEISDEAIFGDVSNTVRDALKRTREISGEKTRIAQTAFEIALRQLV